MFEFTFEMDDVSNEIYVEGFESGVENVRKLLEKVRNESWFKEGNKTEGIVQFFGGDTVDISWKTIDMVIEDGDIFQEEEEYEMSVEWDFVNGETEIV